MNVLIARVRVPLTMLGGLLIVVGSVGDIDPLALAGFVLLVVGLACYFRLGTVRGAPVRVQLPVTGRWVALNSPANRVPSHGVHAYGQTYALDLVHEPPDRPRPAFGSG
ncbi:MAG: hypothetical protein ACRDSN_12125, partial [Pseudonocardiaceae bacterium]